MKFHEILKKIREERNLSTDSVAEKIGVSVAAYRYYERGERQPNFEVLCKIADYFNVSTDYLLGRTDIREPAFEDPLTALNVKKSAGRSAEEFEKAYSALDDRLKAVICQALIAVTEAAKEAAGKTENQPQEGHTATTEPIPEALKPFA